MCMCLCETKGLPVWGAHHILGNTWGYFDTCPEEPGLRNLGVLVQL